MVAPAVSVVSGAVLLGTTISAFAAASITVTPTTGLVNGQTVSITGTGFAKSSLGNVAECNSHPNQPTVPLGSPVNRAVPVSCTAPSLVQIVMTTAKGTVSTTFDVVAGTVGPPCGTSVSLDNCPAADSAGTSPSADAALYPCPPTAAQQAVGDTCTLSYGDLDNDVSTVVILFGSETAPSSTTTTTT